jgi:hypothetical protein
MRNDNRKNNVINALARANRKAACTTNDRFFNMTYNNICKAIDNNTVTNMERAEALQYIHNNRYTVDMIATYNTSVAPRKACEPRMVTLAHIYMYVRQTKEVIYIDRVVNKRTGAFEYGHMYINDEVNRVAVDKYYMNCNKGDIVYVPNMTTMRYAIAYRLALPVGEGDLQIVTMTENQKCAYIAKRYATRTDKVKGMTFEEIKAVGVYNI